MSYNFSDYQIKVFKDEQDGDFGAFIEEWPDISAFGKTPADAINELEIAFNGCIEVAKSEEIPIPEPYRHRNFSGKFVIRIPKSLHRKLVEKAEKEGVSLNQEAVYCITKGLAS